jgi:hypothetical protein
MEAKFTPEEQSLMCLVSFHRSSNDFIPCRLSNKHRLPRLYSVNFQNLQKFVILRYSSSWEKCIMI